MSSVTAGPSSPSTYATRPEITLVSVPVIAYPSAAGSPSSSRSYRDVHAPANTPVRDPRSPAGLIPARSSASQLTSSSSRCCGSIASASRGLIPKNPGSNPAAPATNPPTRAYVSSSPLSQPRSAGNGPIASVPPATSSHRSSGLATPPGNRHPIPTIAIGSCSRPSNSRRRC